MESAACLRTLATHYPASLSEIDRIRQLERIADDVKSRLVGCLNRSLMSPIDGADVRALCGGLHDIVDGTNRIAKWFRTYRLSAVEQIFIAQTDVLARVTTNVSEAVRLLRRCRRVSDFGPTVSEIHRLESRGDDNHHEALSKLFSGDYGLLYVLKWKELHTLIEQTIDGCEDVGNILVRIVLKSG